VSGSLASHFFFLLGERGVPSSFNTNFAGHQSLTGDGQTPCCYRTRHPWREATGLSVVTASSFFFTSLFLWFRLCTVMLLDSHHHQTARLFPIFVILFFFCVAPFSFCLMPKFCYFFFFACFPKNPQFQLLIFLLDVSSYIN
jgi:hypothetical protein